MHKVIATAVHLVVSVHYLMGYSMSLPPVRSRWPYSQSPFKGHPLYARVLVGLVLAKCVGLGGFGCQTGEEGAVMHSQASFLDGALKHLAVLTSKVTR